MKQAMTDSQIRFESEKPVRAPDFTEDNVIGLDSKSAHSVAAELDRHQCSMYVLYHQYQKHHWIVEGPQFRDLHLYLEDSYTGLQKDLDAIAERMTILGAIPTSSPRALADLAYIEHEPEGYFPLRTMLEHDLKAERGLCMALRETIQNASKVNDFGTETLLKQVLMSAEDRAHHLDHYLAKDSLEKGR